MGARPRRASNKSDSESLKCNACRKTFTSPATYQTHMIIVHGRNRQAASTSRSVLTTTVSKEAASKHTESLMPKRIVKAGESKVLELVKENENSSETNLQPPDLVMTESAGSNEDSKVEKKVNFRCPECKSIFTTYFKAFKHIQKFHPIDICGRPVDPYSTSIITPKKVEVCPKCNDIIETGHHHCKEDSKGSYKCCGCSECFDVLRQFDMHAAKSHLEEVESLYFGTYNEFLKFKAEMEYQTKCTFGMMNKYDDVLYFRCTTNSLSNKYCPATITVQEFPNGMQVHLHKKHYGHQYKPYVLAKQFKINSMTKLMRYESDATIHSDLYVQFKTLTESVVLEAAKMGTSHLKLLHGKLLEMGLILNSYVEDNDIIDDEASFNQTLDDYSTTSVKLETQDEICENISSKENKKVKASDSKVSVSTATTQENTAVQGPKLENKKPHARKEMLKPAQIESVLDEIETFEEVRVSARLKKKQSNNNDVDQKVVPSKRTKRAATVTNGRDQSPDEGFFKITTSATIENNEFQPKIVRTFSMADKNFNKFPKEEIPEAEVKNSAVSEIKSNQRKKFELSKSPSFNDTYKDFVEKTIQTTSTPDKRVAPPKKCIRTKLGLFSPKKRSRSTDSSPKNKSVSFSKDSSPKNKLMSFSNSSSKTYSSKSPSSSKKKVLTSKSPNLSQVKIEKYEVKEQDNDCNILILKF